MKGYVSAVPILLFSTAAFAQSVQVQVGVPPPPPPPRVVVTTPPPPPPPSGRVVVTTPPPPPGYYGPPRPMFERPPFPRFRWGWSLEGGPYVFNGTEGGLGGATVRMGAQIDRLWGVYGEVGGFLGGGGAISTNNTSVMVIAAGTFAVMGELDLGDVFYIGLGPELVAGEAGSESAGTSGASVNEAAGVFFGATARLGVVLGRVTPMRRKGFQLGIDFQSIITPGGAVIMPMLSLGMEAF
jgi:hypothetical protein